jgi:hypothetical protein
MLIPVVCFTFVVVGVVFLVGYLIRVQVDPSADDSEEAIATLTEQLRAAVDDPTSLSESETFLLPEGESRTILRDLLRYWVTKTRSGIEPALNSPDDCCLLLASVEFGLTEDLIDPETLEVVNQQRPYLLHTRLLQELLLGSGTRGPRGEAGEAATVSIGTVTTGEPGSDADVTNSGTDTNAVLDFTLPQGPAGTPGTAATVSIGNVTTGANADVTNSGTSTNAVLDFTLPQGVPGPRGPAGPPGPPAVGLNQLMVRPTDMLPIRVAGENQVLPSIEVNLRFASGYPVVRFQQQGLVTFSVLKPGSIREKMPTFFLRLYAASAAEEVSWMVMWRWVRAFGPTIEGPPFNELPGIRPDNPQSPQTELIPINNNDFFGQENLPMRFAQGERGLHLSVSEPLPLAPNIDEPADYLVVYLVPQIEPQTNLFLLMAELRWGEDS